MSNTETLWYGPDKKEAKGLKLSNLKPFSLEAAKAGKPVCTRVYFVIKIESEAKATQVPLSERELKIIEGLSARAEEERA